MDEDEVTPQAKLSADLGAESIDYLDIVFRLEKAFTTDPTKPFKIPRGELFPEDLQTMQNDPKFVQDGKITADGMAELKKRMPLYRFHRVREGPAGGEGAGPVDRRYGDQLHRGKVAGLAMKTFRVRVQARYEITFGHAATET